MLFNGVAVASIAVDEGGRLRGIPRVSAPGLLEAEDPDLSRVVTELAESLGDLPAPLRRDDAALADAAKTTLRRLLGKRLQKRPLVDVHVLRV
jgi:ribonuclease J